MEKKKRMKPIAKISDKLEFKKTDITDEPKNDLPEYGEKSFEKEEVEKLWKDFIDHLQENSGSDSQVMVMKQPYDLNGSAITIHLSNAFQQDILMRFHQDLVGFLRKSLDNRHIEVKFGISEVEREDRPYTNQDKFEYLAKINPTLREMKERLDLDPDF